MPVYIPEADEIYFPKTREYFKEVFSSYSNGNYRSATVMLYSVAVCDILFKLQELKEMYNDSTAIAILKKVEKEQQESSSKSSWEKTLLDEITAKTQLLDLKACSDLNHLFDDRNLSAHPAMNGNYELISPTQETTIAHIKNILNQILVKPPIFIKSVVDMLTDDLKNKKEAFEGEDEKLALFLNNKYYSKMSEAMVNKVFKVLWRFCFCRPDDEQCANNYKINRKALEVLTRNNLPLIQALIKAENQQFNVADDEICSVNLVVFLSSFPGLYKILSTETQLCIKNACKKHPLANSVCWFLKDSLLAHLKDLKHSFRLDKNGYKFMETYYANNGYGKEIIDFYIEHFRDSYNYNCADERFSLAIEPFLPKFTKEQFISLIVAIDGNSQIYNRGASFSTNTIVYNAAKKLLPADFDYSKYPNFKYKADTEESSIGNLEEGGF